MKWAGLLTPLSAMRLLPFGCPNPHPNDRWASPPITARARAHIILRENQGPLRPPLFFPPVGLVRIGHTGDHTGHCVTCTPDWVRRVVCLPLGLCLATHAWISLGLSSHQKAEQQLVWGPLFPTVTRPSAVCSGVRFCIVLPPPCTSAPPHLSLPRPTHTRPTHTHTPHQCPPDHPFVHLSRGSRPVRKTHTPPPFPPPPPL